MKILKKPKIFPCECDICGAKFQPKLRNLCKSSRFIKEEVKCPFCNATNSVVFDRGLKMLSTNSLVRREK